MEFTDIWNIKTAESEPPMDFSETGILQRKIQRLEGTSHEELLRTGNHVDHMEHSHPEDAADLLSDRDIKELRRALNEHESISASDILPGGNLDSVRANLRRRIAWMVGGVASGMAQAHADSHARGANHEHPKL